MARSQTGEELDFLDIPRLRALLRANELVTGNLDLPAVLRHICQAACDLIGARFGALAVMAPDGSPEQFVHVGLTDDVVGEIGDILQGKGRLGRVPLDRAPVRLDVVTRDRDAVGSPTMHPGLQSFLGVPIGVGDQTYGNLYLGEREGGPFTEEDERVVLALARTAGTAIANARRYAEGELRQQWLAASAEIAAQLLAESGEDPLQLIARNAYRIAQADLVALVLVTPDNSAGMVEVAVGQGADELVARQRPLGEILAGQVIISGEPLLLYNLTTQMHGTELIPGEPVIDIGAVMVLPLAGSGEIRGALVIMRRAGRGRFLSAEVEMAGNFATQGAIALELANARVDRQRVALLEDRDRIARDLHDHVIQQLFAVGLSIEGIAASVERTYADRLRSQVADIDRTIRQIRTSIFELRGPLGSAVGATRQRVIEMAAELSRALGFSPQTTFSGQVDLEVVGEQADDLVAVVREALTNVAKHAAATLTRIDLAVVDGRILLTIADNGRGMMEHARTSGLGNMRHRAERWGGEFMIEAAPGGGTIVKWEVPVR